LGLAAGLLAAFVLLLVLTSIFSLIPTDTETRGNIIGFASIVAALIGAIIGYKNGYSMFGNNIFRYMETFVSEGCGCLCGVLLGWLAGVIVISVLLAICSGILTLATTYAVIVYVICAIAGVVIGGIAGAQSDLLAGSIHTDSPEGFLPLILVIILAVVVISLLIWIASIMSPAPSPDIEPPLQGETEIAISPPPQPPSQQPLQGGGSARQSGGGIRGVPANLPVRNTGFIELGNSSETGGIDRRVDSIEFSPDGKKIVTVYPGRIASIWDVESGRELRRLEWTDGGGIRFLRFSPDGGKIFTSGSSESSDDIFGVWDAIAGRLLGTFNETFHNLSLDGKKFVTSNGSTARIRDTESGRVLRAFDVDADRVMVATFSPDGKKVIARFGASNFDSRYARGHQLVRVWDAESGMLLRTLEGHTNRILFCGFSPDGKQIFTSDSTGFRIWDAESLRVLRTWEVPQTHHHISPDWKRIVAGNWNTATLDIWDVDSERVLQTLQGIRGVGWSVDFSSDGKRIVTTSQNESVRIWDAESGQVLRELAVNCWQAVISPDGKRIVTHSPGTTSRHIHIWDAESGEGLYALSASFRGFSPDGRKIVTSDFGITRIWTLDENSTSSGAILSTNRNTNPIPRLIERSVLSSGTAQGSAKTDAIPVTVEEILREYSADRRAAERKYNGKWVAVTGSMRTMATLGTADGGGASLRLFPQGDGWIRSIDVADHPAVRCDFSVDKNDMVSSRFQFHGIVTIVGQCKGGDSSGRDVILVNSEFIDTEEVAGEAKCPRCGSARVDKRGETWLCFECRREW